MVKISKFEEWVYWNNDGVIIPLSVVCFFLVEVLQRWYFGLGNAIGPSLGVSLIVSVSLPVFFLKLVEEQVGMKKRTNSGGIEKEEKKKKEKNEEKASILHLEQVRKLEIERLRVEIANAKNKNRHIGKRRVRR